MARIRTIKPEFWVDDVMVELPFETRLLFIGLWNFVDDEGYIEDKPKRIKMQIFPADDVLIEDSLSALVNSGRLHSYDSDQGPILQIANWGRHQRINRPTPTRFTGIIDRQRGSSVSPQLPVSEHSRGKGKEGKGKERIPVGGETSSPPEKETSPLEVHVNEVTNAAYNAINKGANYLALRGIAKWCVKERNIGVEQFREACASVYGMGKPITKQTIGQYLDGHLAGSGSNQRETRMQANLRLVESFANEAKGIEQ